MPDRRHAHHRRHRRCSVPKGTNVLEAAQAARRRHQLLLLPPGPVVAGGVPAVPGRRQGTAEAGAVLLHARRRQDGGDTPLAARARRRAQQMLEFTLVNHPDRLPDLRQGGRVHAAEACTSTGTPSYARNDGIKVHKAKVVDLGPHIVLDQERCILCTRCIRVCDEVAHEHQLEMAHRGDHEVLTTAPGQQLDNPYSLNTVDVCPVGALTVEGLPLHDARLGARQRRRRVCAGCATGCNVEVHSLARQIQRLVPRENQDVNKYWMCDEGRFTYKRVHEDRLAAPFGRRAGRVGQGARRRRDAACARPLDAAPASSASCSRARSRRTRIIYALARLAFDQPGRRQAPISRASIRAGATTSWSAPT